MSARRAVAAAAVLAALLAAGCGKKAEVPKVDAAAERAAATERIKKNAVYGADVKALEDANKIGADINRKAQERVDEAEKNAK